MLMINRYDACAKTDAEYADELEAEWYAGAEAEL